MNNAKKHNYKILPENRLIIDVWIGEFTFTEIINCKTQQVSDPKWKENYDVLCDVRHAKIEFREDEITNFMKGSKNDPKWNSKRKSASLTSTPDQVVFETMLQELRPSEHPIMINTFSTLHAALKWLGVDLTGEEKINKILEHLSGS